MPTPQLLAPLNRASSMQPVTPDVRPDLHINIVIASMAVGGAERCVYDTLVGLNSRKPTGKVFLMHDVVPSYSLTDCEDVRVFRLGKLERKRKLQTIAMEVIASPLPVVYTHLIRARDLQYLWETGITTIPVIHNSEPGWHDRPDAYDHPSVPFVVAVADSVAKQLRAAGCRKPIVVIRHELQRWPAPEEVAASRIRIRQQYGIDKNTLLIGMVGQFKAHKAYTRAVRVLHQVQQFRKAKLMILGGWDHSYGSGRATYVATCRKALDLGVLADMIVPGSVFPVEPYYAAFDLFLNTSIYEGLSISTLEAIQSGCPVITADVGGQREALAQNSVLIGDPSDISAYVAAIKRIGNSIQREPKKPPAKPDLVPRLWCLLGKHGVENSAARPTTASAESFFLTSNLNPGGAQRSLANLLSHLPAGHKTFLCLLAKVSGESYLQALEAANIPVVSLGHSGGLLARVESILELIAHLGVRNLCFWNLDPEIKLLITKILSTRSIRIIDISPGPMLFYELEQTSDFQRRICFDLNQYFQRLDRFVTKYQNGGLPSPYDEYQHKLAVIPNGVPIPPEEPERRTFKMLLPATADPGLAIVTCCRIVPNKRLEWLIQVMSVLKRRLPGVTLTIVGGVDQRHIPYWESVVRKVEDEEMSNTIHFAGGHPDVFSFLDQFKVFIMVSYAQGCPNASLEAMAMGLPVIANADGGTAEQVQDGVNGLLVSGEDPVEMATQIQFLLENPEIAEAFGRRGRDIARRKFSMSQMVKNYMQLLNSGELPSTSAHDYLRRTVTQS